MDTPTPPSVVASPAPAAPSPLVVEPIESPKTPRRGVNLPGWLAVVILIGVAGGFGYLGWRLVAADPKIDLSQYEDTSGRPGRRIANNPIVRAAAPLPVEGVTLETNGNGSARIKTLNVSFLVSGAKPTVVAAAPPQQGIDPNDTLARRVRAVAMSETARRAAAGVTDEQVAKLRAIKLPTLPVVNPAARERLLGLWAQLRAADTAARPGVEKQLLDALREISSAHAAADAAAYRATADQIRAILTPEQIEALRRPAK